jgi:hypothetical protein
MTKRTVGRNRQKISVEAIAAWKRGDRMAVYFALGLKPWNEHPFDVREEHTPEPDNGTVWAEDYAQILELRNRMIEIAGEPGTKKEDAND